MVVAITLNESNSFTVIDLVSIVVSLVAITKQVTFQQEVAIEKAKVDILDNMDLTILKEEDKILRLEVGASYKEGNSNHHHSNPLVEVASRTKMVEGHMVNSKVHRMKVSFVFRKSFDPFFKKHNLTS